MRFLFLKDKLVHDIPEGCEIIGVGVIIFHTAHFLQCVNDDQHCVGIVFEELCELPLQTFLQNVALGAEADVGRDFIRDTEEPVLDAARRIFQTEIERSALLCPEVPHGFTLGDGGSQPESQPGFSHFRCTCEDVQSLGDERVHYEVHRLHRKAHQGFAADGVEGVVPVFILRSSLCPGTAAGL